MIKINNRFYYFSTFSEELKKFTQGCQLFSEAVEILKYVTPLEMFSSGFLGCLLALVCCSSQENRMKNLHSKMYKVILYIDFIISRNNRSIFTRGCQPLSKTFRNSKIRTDLFETFLAGFQVLACLLAPPVFRVKTIA